MKRVTYLDPAQEELMAAARYYEKQRSGLGPRFLEATKELTIRIQENPLSGKVVYKKIRRRLVKKWPYTILYRVDPDEIAIVAVMHKRRSPDYWHDRI